MFLQPERVPVKVYLSTDKDAPRLDRTPNCVATILKACLVTGYGDKEGAGWSLAFEDNTKGIKVLKPAESPHTPFFMRISGDTGRQIKFEVLQNMTSVDDGELKLSFANSFQYTSNFQSGKWLLVASERSFTLLVEMGNSATLDKRGECVFCGDTAKNTRGERAVVLINTQRYGITSTNAETQARLLVNNGAFAIRPTSFFNGMSNKSTHAICSPIVLEHGGEIYGLPMYLSSNVKATNHETINSFGRAFINYGHSMYSDGNLFIPTDYWEY